VIALSTASVYPETTANGFELASRLGYDAVEVMVGIDPISQETDAVRHLSEYHEIPVCAVHAPCLLITQRVWGVEPWGKLEKSAEMARAVGADVVVVHPPFRWQRDYARGFVDVSHSAVARQDPVAMARRLGDRLRHIHMTDGTGSAKDEHLVPGRGTQPVVELLEHLAGVGFGGHVVLEINTRKAATREAREMDLMEALAFTRLNFAAAPESS
jgi:sugar phosphate isomerase/epimerase